MIENILQFDFGDAPTSAVSLAPFVMWGVFAIVAILGGYVFARWMQKRMHYKSIGTPIDPVRITWENKYAGIEGYLSKVELLTDEQFDALALQNDVKVNVEILKSMKKDGHVNVYFLNMTDESESSDSFNDTFIVSPYPLEDLGWYDQQGKRYMYAMFDRIRRKNLFFLKTSSRHTITNPDGELEDWWLVSPKLDGETKEFVGYKGNDTFEPLQHVFQTTVIEGGMKLVKELSFVTKLAEALEQNIEYKAKAEMFEKLHGKKVAQLLAKHIKTENWKMGLTRKPYVVLTKEDVEKQTGVNAVWIAMSAVIGGITSWMLPDFIPQVSEQSATMLGIVVSAIMMLAVFKLATDQAKKKQFDESEDDEE